MPAQRSHAHKSCASGTPLQPMPFMHFHMHAIDRASQINLFLRVVRRREDGFHDLASLFHVIDLGDHMSFAVRPNATEDSLSCNMEGVPTDSSNLVIKVSVISRL
jgi:4-diphosphocytidyl-2C-methyl-D-erythritol kinase